MMFSQGMNLITLLVIVIATISFTAGNGCVPRDFGYGSPVCVCNSTYCDATSKRVPRRGHYRTYETSKDGKRMSERDGRFHQENTHQDHNTNDIIEITLNVQETYQKINGFGGAFTDSAGINIKSLSLATQNRIIEAYFGESGNRYNLCRVPVGGTDFSTRPYTYLDTKDETLNGFSLAEEDTKYKIPLMKKALEMNPELKFISAAWTAPPWMKTNNDYSGFGFLMKEYYQTYANYLLKFLLEYKNQGLKIWGISTGNEPNGAFVPFFRLSTMGWMPTTVATWMAENLGPTIASSESNDTLIFIIDDQRFNLPWYVVRIFRNAKAKNYTAGIAVHFYTDGIVPANVLDSTQHLYPDKFLLMTEGCVGSFLWEYPKVRLGDWGRAEHYILNIIQNLNHWVTGWIDWNLALDKNGGPNWIDNFVDAPIIVNPETDEFFKQPYFYVLGHFSKFIARGSVRIGSTRTNVVENVAFLTPDNETVIVLYNRDHVGKTIVVNDPDLGKLSTDVSPYSLITIIYKR